jgi:hypothetical protein
MKLKTAKQFWTEMHGKPRTTNDDLAVAFAATYAEYVLENKPRELQAFLDYVKEKYTTEIYIMIFHVWEKWHAKDYK